MDNAIGFPKTYPLGIYPVDSAIQRLNNRGLCQECQKNILFGLKDHGLHLKRTALRIYLLFADFRDFSVTQPEEHCGIHLTFA